MFGFAKCNTTNFAGLLIAVETTLIIVKGMMSGKQKGYFC
jgi:hypothetical protein